MAGSHYVCTYCQQDVSLVHAHAHIACVLSRQRELDAARKVVESARQFTNDAHGGYTSHEAKLDDALAAYDAAVKELEAK
jgi:L-alanine-DL-glutamate epimerase-like enolase superfamily enzyme